MDFQGGGGGSGGSFGGDRPITIQDVFFRFYLQYFNLMQTISYNTDMMAFSRAARNAYFMVDSLFSVTHYYMDAQDVREYERKGELFRNKYAEMKTKAHKNVLVTESTDKINNLYIRLANDRLKIISGALGRKGIIKEHRAAAMVGDETMVKVGAGGKILSDGDKDTDDSSIDVVVEELDKEQSDTDNGT